MFNYFFFIVFFTLDTNQVLQVPLQRQEATSRLPREGLSQLWIQQHQNTHATSLSDLNVFIITLANSLFKKSKCLYFMYLIQKT